MDMALFSHFTTRQTASGAGPLTGCDLGDLGSLVLPFAQDPFYRLRPPFSGEAAALSLELAAMAYTLDLSPWTAAGWGDASMLIDDELHHGLIHTESGTARLLQRFRLLRAKAALREINPLSQVRGALRQREKSDTIKALCMMHPLEDGKYLLAIGFMGTGTRFYDWFSNFRFSTEEGFHQGFYQLCDSFEQNAEEIRFPQTAKELGLERLTLGDVLMEMRSLSSRFRLWMAGHSQGGAVMQVFTHRLMHDWGVLAQNLVGYGFASPTVATGRLVYDPASYPLYHLINTDDVVPHLGALVHLGLGLDYPSSEAMRSLRYAPFEDREAIELLKPIRAKMLDTPSALVEMAALCKCLAQEKGEEGLMELMERAWATPAVDRMLMHAGDRALDGLGRALAAMEAAYLDLTGRMMDLHPSMAEIAPIVRQLTVRRLLAAMSHIAAQPHSISGAYAHLCRNGLHDLQPFIWVKQPHALPIRRYAGWDHTWSAPVHSVLRARRGQRLIIPRKSKMRLGAYERSTTHAKPNRPKR